MSSNIPNITKDLLDEYFNKLVQKRLIESECKNLSNRIKYEMGKVDCKQILLHGYKISLETKYEPIPKFFELLEKNDLSYLITKTITGNHLKSAKRYLGIKDEEFEKYLKEKDTKWLYITRDM